MRRLFFVLPSLVVIACTTTSTNRDPAGSKGQAETIFNFTPQEEKAFSEDGARVTTAAKALAEKFKNDKTRSGRVFHEKSHGCLTGELVVLNSRPEDPTGATYAGLFKSAARYPVIARFSNGVGSAKPDYLPDVRGLALKIFVGDNGVVDFLMTNATNPLGRDHKQFVEFMEANVKGDIPTLAFAAHQLKLQKDLKKQGLVSKDELPYLTHFLRSVSGAIVNPAKERYWSGHPYGFGPGTYMKFNVTPEGWSHADDLKYESRGFVEGALNRISVGAKLAKAALNPKKKTADYLRTELEKTVAQQQIRYKFMVQLYKDPTKTPIDDTLVEWTEAVSPSIQVAELVFDQNQDISNKNRERACSGLRFTPGHVHPDHVPAGNLGRGRLYSYKASQTARAGAVDAPAKKEIVQNWKNGIY